MSGFSAIAGTVVWLFTQATGPVGSLAASAAVAALFAVAGLHKVRHPLLAAAAADNLGLPVPVRRPTGYGIAAAELTTAALLLGGWTSKPLGVLGAVAAVVLSTVLVTLVALAVVRGAEFPCHCFSANDDPISVISLARAVLMLAGAVIVSGSLLRGDALPTLDDIVAAVGVAAAYIGLPMFVVSGVRLWRSARELRSTLDWEWLILSRPR